MHTYPADMMKLGSRPYEANGFLRGAYVNVIDNVLRYAFDEIPENCDIPPAVVMCVFLDWQFIGMESEDERKEMFRKWLTHWRQFLQGEIFLCQDTACNITTNDLRVVPYRLRRDYVPDWEKLDA